MDKGSEPKKKSKFRKAFEAVAVGAAVVTAAVTGTGLAQAAEGDAPDHVYVFSQGADAQREPDDGASAQWNAMMRHQHEEMRDQNKRQAFDELVTQSQKFRSHDVYTMAQGVNGLVHDKIQYVAQPGFATPVDTAQSGKGDAQDSATLEDAIMHRLKPDVQTMVARVNAEGNQAAGPDYTVLLVKDSPNDPGIPPRYLLMSNFKNVVRADNNVVEKTMLINHHPAHFAVVDLRNSEGAYWKANPKVG